MSSAVETLTLQKEAVPLLRSRLAMKKAALQFSLERYDERLRRFERQYDMDSATFAARFERGELGDDADWMPTARHKSSSRSWSRSSYDVKEFGRV
jgi:hypothetical protein